MGDDKMRSPFYIHAGLKIYFWMVTGHNDRQKKFLLGRLVFLTGQKLGKKVN